MSLSDFEIGKIAEIVAGKMGTKLDAKTLRRVVDGVVDGMQANQGNPDIQGVTCDVSASKPAPGGPAAPLPPEQALYQDHGGLYEKIDKSDGQRVIIAAFGKDRSGIVASITAILAENNCSIEDISQTLMQEFFSMIMVVNTAGSSVDMTALRDKMQATESQLGMKVYMMHEDIFQYMHRI